MTEPAAIHPPADTWEAVLDALRRRYPGQRDSVLFCLYKLQQNPDLSLRDFREEAQLYGITAAGRALHSAKALLGLGQPAATKVARAAEDEPREPRARRARRPDDGGASIESKVVDAVRQIQQAAGAESDQLRAAIRQAVAILQRALGDA